MVHAGTEPGHEEAAEERQVASREAGGDEAQRGGRRARGEETCLAPALGEQPSGDLEGGHGAAVHGAEETDLGEGEAELAGPHGKEDVQDVGEAVVDEMRAAGGAEDGAGSAHAPDCVMDVTTALATPPLLASKGHARRPPPPATASRRTHRSRRGPPCGRSLRAGQWP